MRVTQGEHGLEINPDDVQGGGFTDDGGFEGITDTSGTSGLANFPSEISREEANSNLADLNRLLDEGYEDDDTYDDEDGDSRYKEEVTPVKGRATSEQQDVDTDVAEWTAEEKQSHAEIRRVMEEMQKNPAEAAKYFANLLNPEQRENLFVKTEEEDIDIELLSPMEKVVYDQRSFLKDAPTRMAELDNGLQMASLTSVALEAQMTVVLESVCQAVGMPYIPLSEVLPDVTAITQKGVPFREAVIQAYRTKMDRAKQTTRPRPNTVRAGSNSTPPQKRTGNHMDDWHDTMTQLTRGRG